MLIKNKYVRKILLSLLVKYVASETEKEYFKHSGTWQDVKKYLKTLIQDFMFEIYNERPLVEFLISSICELEMHIPIIKNEELRDNINTSDVVNMYTNTTMAQEKIPKDTLYCGNCPFQGHSKIASLIFGSHYSGYCYYLGKGDFSFIRPTSLLWDGCKECGIEFEEDEEKSI